MRRTFVRKLGLTLASLISVMSLGGPIPGGADETEEQSELLEPLAECVKEKPSSWLLLVDTSQSLRESDPDDRRVSSLKLVVDQLAALNSKQAVYLEVLEFGATVRRPQRMGEDLWLRLEESNKRNVVRVIEELARSDSDRHTDYLRALRPLHPRNNEGIAGDEIGVIDLFEEQRLDTCQVLL